MKSAAAVAKGLFPDLEERWQAQAADLRMGEYAQRFRAAYPEKKRNTHAERLRPAIAKAMAGLSAVDAELLFDRALLELAVHRLSERWQDAAFIPHMASWWSGRYWEHDRAEYRPQPFSKDDRCPHCGRTWRVHPIEYATGRYDCDGIRRELEKEQSHDRKGVVAPPLAGARGSDGGPCVP